MHVPTIFACLAAGAACAAAHSPPRSFHDFSASRDGFAFVNRFSGSSLPGPLALLHDAFGAPDEFGLCGGMCFAAADFYLAGQPIPAHAGPQPTRGQPLYDYIYQRQVDSFGPNLTFAAKFSRWMDMPDSGPHSVGWATLAELDAVLDALDRREPVHLGLVYVDSKVSRVPWQNHQVLATRATFEPQTDRGITACSLRVYDPNHPGNDAARIDLQLILDGFARTGHDRSPVVSLRCTQVFPRTDSRSDRVRNVRGLFPMPYAPKVPPESLR
jgi:hypothetical protein